MISKSFKFFVAFLSIGLFFTSCSSDDDSSSNDNDEEVVIIDPDTDPDPDTSSCQDPEKFVFIEKDGLVSIEAEQTVYANTSWESTKTISDYSGESYLLWNGEDFLNQPGNGLLAYKINITNPGTYRFIWRSYIAVGDSNTDRNDSWLRIPDANHFYGKRKADGNIVYPKGTQLPPIAESEGQESTEPEGAGRDGWFKIYMNTNGSWRWQSSTSDNNAHDIYVVFDNPGEYTVQISGRSNGHAIDKFVLFADSLSQDQATDENVTASEITCL